MHASTLLITLAAAVSASEVQHHEAVKRAMAMEARQATTTDLLGSIPTGDLACVTSLTGLASLYDTLPTPTGELASALITQTGCSISVPTSLSAQASSYTSAVMSWASANAAPISSAMAACPALVSAASSLVGQVCTDMPGATGGSGTSGVAKPTGGAGGSGGSGGASGNGTSPAPIDPAKAMGSRNSVVAAGMAAAGFLGAAVLL